MQHERAEEVQVGAVVVHSIRLVGAQRTSLDHRSARVGVEFCSHRAQCPRLQHDIVVDQQALVVASGGDADVARAAGALVGARVDDANGRELRRHEFSRAVVAVVVDHEDLVGGRILGLQRR